MTKFLCLHDLVKAGLLGVSAFALSACNAIDLPFGQTAAASATSPDLTRPAAAAQSDTNGLEVEAPDVFYLEQTGLWDGRPSLGGVWVAHPDVTDPERVLVTNNANGETVVGALFRRERENHGPEIMVSSDAAAALNVIAGQPTEFTIVALRPQEVPEDLNLAVPPPEPADLADLGDAEADVPEDTALPATIAAATLEAAPVEAAENTAFDVAALAESAIAETAAPAPAPTPTATLSADQIFADTAAIDSTIPAAILAGEAAAIPEVAPAPQIEETAALAPTTAALPELVATPLPELSQDVEEVAVATPQPDLAAAEELTRPFVQVGVFSSEANADNVAGSLRNGGVIPTVLDQSNAERSLFRVIVGPARNSADRAALLETVQGLGYEDAYFVTN